MQCQSKLPYSAVFFCFLLFFTVAPALADNQESEFTMGGVFSLLLKSSHTSTLLPALQGGHEAILEWKWYEYLPGLSYGRSSTGICLQSLSMAG